MRTKLKLIFSLAAVGVVFFTFGPTVGRADHSWNNFHWARTANPFNLTLGDNLSSNWDLYLASVATDWSQSSVLDTLIVPGGTSARRCRPTGGRVEVCNYKYGSNGWLGLAQVWLNGDHITQGIVKVNDTYFNRTSYNTPAWRNLVLCQEIGHTLGLDHQDEDFYNFNLGTCMDYTALPDSNQHPNPHDYEELEAIYQHLDGTVTVSQPQVFSGNNQDLENPGQWGKLVKTNGKNALFVRDFGKGKKVVTFIVPAT